MLAIRLQRTGRKGHAQFRVIVQDSHQSPSSGKVVASLGSFNPHTKVQTIDQEKTTFYLNNGARPSDRVARLLQSAGVTLPSWVTTATVKDRTTRNPQKLRKNNPVSIEPVVEATPESESEEVSAEVKTPVEQAETASEEPEEATA